MQSRDWTSLIAAANINNAGTSLSAAIDLVAHRAVEIAVTCIYDASTATGPLKVAVCRNAAGTYEVAADKPFEIALPYTANTTHRRVLTVRREDVGQCKVLLTNSSGATVNAAVSIRYID